MSRLHVADIFSCLDVQCNFSGALDDEEFVVVEGSGGGGVTGSLDSQVTCHQLVSVTQQEKKTRKTILKKKKFEKNGKMKK